MKINRSFYIEIAMETCGTIIRLRNVKLKQDKEKLNML